VRPQVVAGSRLPPAYRWRATPVAPVPTKNLVHLDFVDFSGVGPLVLQA
jgi:hypothetical protein